MMSITRSHDQDWHRRNARFVQPLLQTSRLIERKDYQNILKCVPHGWRLSPRQWPMFDSSLWPFSACHPVSLSLLSLPDCLSVGILFSFSDMRSSPGKATSPL